MKFINGNIVMDLINWESEVEDHSTDMDDHLISSSVYMVNPTVSNINISGFDVDSEFKMNGTMLWLMNTNASNTITLKHNTTSTTGNRIFTSAGTDYVINPYSQTFLIYCAKVGREGWWLF